MEAGGQGRVLVGKQGWLPKLAQGDTQIKPVVNSTHWQSSSRDCCLRHQTSPVPCRCRRRCRYSAHRRCCPLRCRCLRLLLPLLPACRQSRCRLGGCG